MVSDQHLPHDLSVEPDVPDLPEMVDCVSSEIPDCAQPRYSKCSFNWRCFNRCGAWFLAECDNDDKECFYRKILKKFFFFLVFLVISTIIAIIVVPKPPLLYYMTRQIRSIFITNRFLAYNNVSINFNEIYTTRDFWTYLEVVFPRNYYWEDWYNGKVPVKPTNDDDQNVLYENVQFGRPRMRQLRVQKHSCYIPPSVKTNVSRCYYGYSYEKTSKTEIDHSENCGDVNPWKYYEPSVMEGMAYRGKVAWYDTGGFYIILSTKRKNAKSRIDCLKRNLWVSRKTRVVFLDFTLYNPNMNLFVVVKLVFEFPPTGGVITSYSIRPLKLLRYLSLLDYIILGLEIVFVLYIIFYTIEEILEMICFTWEYFCSVWNLVDLSIILLAYVAIVLNVLIYVFAKRKVDEVVQDTNNYHSFDTLAYLGRTFNNVAGALVFLIWMKLFKFFNFSRILGQLGRTLAKCAREICGFSLMFFVVFFAFAQAGYLLFGDQVEAFSTFWNSMVTLLMTILGDFSYHEIAETSRILAPIFFATYIFFIFFVLFNMFLAIVTDAYIEVKTDFYTTSTDLQMSDVLKRAPRKCCSMMGRRAFWKRSEMPGNEIINSLRKILRLCKFTDAQIDALYCKYKIDESEPITEVDICVFMAELKTNIYQGENSRLKRTCITAQQYACQRNKIDVIDHNVKILISKLISFERKLKKKSEPGSTCIDPKRMCFKREEQGEVHFCD